jgi:hypothetical protein
VATVRVVAEDISLTLDGERKTVTALFADIKGLDGLDGRPRPRGGARDHRPGAQA